MTEVRSPLPQRCFSWQRVSGSARGVSGRRAAMKLRCFSSKPPTHSSRPIRLLPFLQWLTEAIARVLATPLWLQLDILIGVGVVQTVLLLILVVDRCRETSRCCCCCCCCSMPPAIAERGAAAGGVSAAATGNTAVNTISVNVTLPAVHVDANTGRAHSRMSKWKKKLRF